MAKVYYYLSNVRVPYCPVDAWRPERDDALLQDGPDSPRLDGPPVAQLFPGVLTNAARIREEGWCVDV